MTIERALQLTAEFFAVWTMARWCCTESRFPAASCAFSFHWNISKPLNDMQSGLLHTSQFPTGKNPVFKGSINFPSPAIDSLFAAG